MLPAHGKDGQLRSAAKAHRQDGGPDAAAHIHPRAAHLIPTSEESSRTAGQPERPEERYAHLTAVRMARERQRAAAGDLVEVRRRVKERDDKRAGRHVLESVQIGRTGGGIVQPENPDVLAHGPDFIEQEMYRSEERRVGKECRSRWSPYH